MLSWSPAIVYGWMTTCIKASALLSFGPSVQLENLKNVDILMNVAVLYVDNHASYIQWNSSKLESLHTGICFKPNIACGPKFTKSFIYNPFKPEFPLNRTFCLALRWSVWFRRISLYVQIGLPPYSLHIWTNFIFRVWFSCEFEIW